MKGKISKIWVNDLDDGRTYLTLKIGNERYTLWDKVYFKKIKEGDTVAYDFRKSGNGKYKNINTIKKIQTELPTNTELPSGNYESNNYKSGLDSGDKKDLEIVRMSALKNAVYATRDLIDIELGCRADAVVDMARKFEDYITEHEDRKLPDYPQEADFPDSGNTNGKPPKKQEKA